MLMRDKFREIAASRGGSAGTHERTLRIPRFYGFGAPEPRDGQSEPRRDEERPRGAPTAR